jgi:hypothetical protein
VNGATDAVTLAAAIRPALGSLITPMTKFVGNVVVQSGVSVQGNTVTVNSHQTVLTVNGYAAVRALLISLAPLLIHFLASHYLLKQGF